MQTQFFFEMGPNLRIAQGVFYKFHKKFKLEVRKFCKYIGIKLKRSGRNVSTKRTTKHSVGFPNHTNVAKHKRICAHHDSHSAQDLNITRRTNNQIDSKMLLTCSQTRTGFPFHSERSSSVVK